MTDQVRLGIAGAGGRGGAFRIPATDDDRVDVRAVCDVDPEAVEAARSAFDAAEGYRDFHAMLWEADLDAVLIATPKELHVPQSVAALERDLHVLCEVPAGRSVEELEELVRAARASAGTYMLAENDVFRPSWTLIAELVADGRFGDVYYCRGERVSRDTDKMERTPWRRTWRGGRNGVTYPTHTFGPILRWFPDERVERLACAGSGHHYVDPRGEQYDQEDTVVLLAKTDRDHLIVHRQDIISERPSVTYRFELQGTAGCFESAAHPDDEHRIALSGETDGWTPLETFESSLPERWRNRTERERRTGRDGGDYLLFESFVDAIVADEPAPIDVVEGVEMTLPGLLSERSIAADGEWVDVPDPRSW